MTHNLHNITPPQRPKRAGLTLVGVLATLALVAPQLASMVSAAPGTGGAPESTDTTTTTTTTVPDSTTTTTVPPTETTTTTTTTTTVVPTIETTTTTTTTTSTSTTSTTTTVPAPPTTAAPAPQDITIFPEQIGHVLATIRYMESRGQYHLPPNKGNASGAYQFIGSTWGNYAGYAHAYLAPPAIQDERAAKDVTLFLDRWNNDVSMIPVLWYYPKAARNPALMDIVPVPSAGNTLTIREYQQRWLAVFATISGEPIPQGLTLADAAAQLGLPPSPPLRDDDLPSVAFPVLGPSRLAAPDCDAVEAPDTGQTSLGGSTSGTNQISRADIEAAGLCTPDAPSIVFGVKLQPILVAAEGVVTDVQDDPASGQPITVTITDTDGRSYIYSGFNDDNQGTNDGAAPDHLRLTALAKVGQTVWAGQIIGFMGDTDPLPVGVRADVPTDATVVIDPDAVAPHIRLTIVDLDGTAVDAFGPVVDALFSTSCRAGIGPWSVPAQATSGQPIVVETTDDDDEIDSEWIITATGQVTAAGWAALINPSGFCTWTPDVAFGPGASGSNDVPGRWWFGLDLPTDIWLGLALNADTLTAPPLIRL